MMASPIGMVLAASSNQPRTWGDQSRSGHSMRWSSSVSLSTGYTPGSPASIRHTAPGVITLASDIERM